MIGRTNSSSMNNATAALDFTVVDGLTEPVNPKEKMIWIATDEEITSWTFSATEPVARQGMVWFLIGKSSSVAFSITKDNPIMVYPIEAQQYINNVWVEKTTKIYLNGEWTKWHSTIYWFKSGEGSDNIWNKHAEGNQSLVVFSEQYIKFQNNDQANNNLRATTKEKINLTNLNTLYFYADRDSNMGGWFGVTQSVTPNTGSVTFLESVHQTNGNAALWELDISELEGEYYIAIQFDGWGVAHVYDVYGI